ncbi:MAG: amidohydrolase [Anaerolineae bacterium]|nr:amidohydrolase [Anaerolineae bacterium]
MEYVNILERAQDMDHLLSAWRRDIHMNPEISFEEHRTAQMVADTLRAMGIRVETQVGKTGVVGHLGEGRPAIGIRADMDALPIQEANDVPYASTVPGKMHACGHDAHTSILLGVARLLTEMDNRPPGEIRFLFQPSEEDQDAHGKSGAMYMIEDEALDNLDAVIALHVASTLTSGMVMIRSGYASAAVDSFEATIIGEGCHGAYPHFGNDPIFMLAQVVNAIHGIRARRIDPVHPAVISIGAVHAGSANNIIPDKVEINGTIRSFDSGIREQLLKELEQALSITRSFGGDYSLRVVRGYPSLHNDHEVSAVIEQVAVDLLGAEGVHPPEVGMGAEDFSYMAQKAPGAMFNLGAKFDAVNRPHHSPIFDLDESSFPIGAAMLAETACRLLKLKANGHR